MKDFNETVTRSRTTLLSAANDLSYIRDAASTLGQYVLVKDLDRSISAMRTVANDIHSSWGIEIGRQMEQVQQSSLNMVKATLSAVSMEKQTCDTK